MAIIEVIQYEGDKNTLVYRYPNTEFNTLSQLIAHESQKAVFFKNGQMLDVMEPGKYTLHTGNIPLLNKLINLPTGGVSQFQCQVYFVNTALALNYKWGTTSKTRVMDNHYHLLLEIGASGILGLKVVNPQILLEKIVGTELELTADTCLEYFRENVSARVKEYLAKIMQKPEMDFLMIEMFLNDFSLAVKEKLQEIFQDVGVELYNFVVGTISIPDDQYQVIIRGQQELQAAEYDKKLRRIQAESNAESGIIEAQGRAKSMQIEGYNWIDIQVAEILKTYVGNPGFGQNPTNTLSQVPMALAFGNMLKDNVEPLMNIGFSTPPLNFNNISDMKKGQSDLDTDNIFGNFDNTPFSNIEPEDDNESNTDVSGFSLNADTEEMLEKLSLMKKMLDKKLITQEQYDTKVEEILRRI